MKNLYLFLMMVLFSHTIMGQPTITSDIAPEIGETWTITFMENNSFDPQAGGANQVWDFSGLDTSNTITLEIQTLDPEEVGGGPTYPNADIVWYLEGFDVYNYYNITEDSISLVGGASISDSFINFETVFIDPEDGLQFPISFGTEYEYYSYFEQFVFGTPVGFNERFGTVEADGYGTVITPNGTFENLLRLIITETSFGFTSVQYAWFEVDNFVPVFLYEESDDPGSVPTLYFSDPKIVSSNFDQNQNELIGWNAWFSKAEQKIVVEFSDIEANVMTDINLFTINGERIGNAKIDPSQLRHTLELPALPENTTVIISLEMDNRISSKKILINR